MKRLVPAWLAGLGLLSACGPSPAPVDEMTGSGSTSSNNTSDPTVGPTNTGPTTDPTGSTTERPPIPTPPPLPVCPAGAVSLSEWNLSEIPAELGLADLDGDGDLDLFAALPASGAIELAFGDGAGALAPGGLFEVAAASEPGLKVAAVDLDGDGDADLAAARPDSGDLAIFFGEKGVFTPGPLLATGVRWVRAGDVEGDGDVDLIAAGKDGTSVSVWAADGMGAFEPGVVSLGPFEVTTLRDATGDGLLDLIAVSGTTLQVFAGAPDLTFQLGENRDLGSAGWSQGLVASLGGTSPGLVALQGELARVSMWPGSGPGMWSPDRVDRSTSWPLLGGLAADFDGDGFEDVLAATPEPVLALLLAQGDGGLACADALTLVDVTAQDLIAAGDLDGGGDLEIVAGGQNVPVVSILSRP